MIKTGKESTIQVPILTIPGKYETDKINTHPYKRLVQLSEPANLPVEPMLLRFFFFGEN